MAGRSDGSDPLKRFSDRADDYASFRPSYPTEAIDAVLDGLARPEALTIADVGAGTGISARLLADRGPRVIAIEPNEAMRSAAEPHQRVWFLPDTAEQTRLADASVDIVVCAQAFHWFDAERALDEFSRILQRPGRIALMWNVRDESDPLTAAYGKAVGRSGAEKMAQYSRDSGGILTQNRRFDRTWTIETPYDQRLDLNGLLGRARSASYVPKDGESWDRVERELTEAHRDSADPAGMVTLKHMTRLDLAELLD